MNVAIRTACVLVAFLCEAGCITPCPTGTEYHERWTVALPKSCATVEQGQDTLAVIVDWHCDRPEFTRLASCDPRRAEK